MVSSGYYNHAMVTCSLTQTTTFTFTACKYLLSTSNNKSLKLYCVLVNTLFRTIFLRAFLMYVSSLSRQHFTYNNCIIKFNNTNTLIRKALLFLADLANVTSDYIHSECTQQFSCNDNFESIKHLTISCIPTAQYCQAAVAKYTTYNTIRYEIVYLRPA